MILHAFSSLFFSPSASSISPASLFFPSSSFSYYSSPSFPAISIVYRVIAFSLSPVYCLLSSTLCAYVSISFDQPVSVVISLLRHRVGFTALMVYVLSADLLRVFHLLGFFFFRKRGRKMDSFIEKIFKDCHPS